MDLQLGTLAADDGTVATVWYACVSDHAGQVQRYSRELLSGEELQRLATYRSAEAAARFVVTRALMRSVLSGFLGVAPSDVPVSRTNAGKPVVGDRVHFNVSHSADLVLLAVSTARAVGVDVERRRELPRVEALIDRWLTDAERQAVGRIAAAGLGLSDAFLRVWSLKEAKLKALGVGIAGAASASTDAMEACPLDALLEKLPAAGDAGYVGALAFA